MLAAVPNISVHKFPDGTKFIQSKYFNSFFQISIKYRLLNIVSTCRVRDKQCAEKSNKNIAICKMIHFFEKNLSSELIIDLLNSYYDNKQVEKQLKKI